MLEILGALAAAKPKGITSHRGGRGLAPMSASDLQFFAAMDGLLRQRGAIISKARASGELSDELDQALTNGATLLAAMTAEANAELRGTGHVNWTDFWKNLPPLGVNMQGPTGFALNTNGTKIVKLVLRQKAGAEGVSAPSRPRTPPTAKKPNELVRTHVLGAAMEVLLDQIYGEDCE